ncbi:hypothetical protein Hanom_Chr13g01222401 [Helianthus anomalus]
MKQKIDSISMTTMIISSCRFKAMCQKHESIRINKFIPENGNYRFHKVIHIE